MSGERPPTGLPARLWHLVLLGWAVGLFHLTSPGAAEAAKPGATKPATPATPAKTGKTGPTIIQGNHARLPVVPRSALLAPEDWQKAPMTPLAAGEIDGLVAKELAAAKIEPAPPTTDEQFIRRVTLDLTGRLPVPADTAEFVASAETDKRAKLVDKLLNSDRFARHFARYWRDVVTAKVDDRRFVFFAEDFEDWLHQQFRLNKSWGDVATAMITATGELSYGQPGSSPAAFFLASHRGPDGAIQRTSETSRIFLGIQIQCAQCHDHPSDQWKRVQFHELAGYFARVRERIINKPGQPPEVSLVSLQKGEHEMPSKEDPKLTTVTPPRFLDGHNPGNNLGDLERRRDLAAQITSRKNFWFGAAFVNRVWGELMGQAFYQPVDDMGPQKLAVFPEVLTRLTGSFRGTNYDIKALLRAILVSETYQRQIRLGATGDEHLQFAAAYPTRLRADALWDSLEHVLGPLTQPRPGAGAGQGMMPTPAQRRFGGLEAAFKMEFDFDPSLKADEVEGSVPQALFLMNNPQLNTRIRAEGTNLLARVLKAFPDNDDAIRRLYERVLARKPTDRELSRCKSHLASVTSRAEGFEDILWALLNSTEFQTKR